MIRSKRQMYSLYERGSFGNKLQTWQSPADLNGYAGTLSMRYAGKAGGGLAAYEVPRNEVEARITEWVRGGADPKLVRLNESAPDSRLTIQGEVSDWIGGLVLRCSTWKGKMRDAMRYADHFYGVEAAAILRSYLFPSSYEDVRDLLDLHRGAVVEFSAYEMSLGDCRGRNAVIWEVRNY